MQNEDDNDRPQYESHFSSSCVDVGATAVACAIEHGGAHCCIFFVSTKALNAYVCVCMCVMDDEHSLAPAPPMLLDSKHLSLPATARKASYVPRRWMSLSVSNWPKYLQQRAELLILLGMRVYWILWANCLRVMRHRIAYRPTFQYPLPIADGSHRW